ncbi:Uma2 family endonuclease [Sphingomonas sp. S1-29]|uniref:Uma2 family endonuclease n=1 Tax=Sphingomonas sp. S1-29 TaxID=2991074 RepID=UPI002240AA20|nr:Uma2 family endonuclease [Sphingomonas sp. S1-29]UZK69109.1 Uma2 family endonuclease [Sphingomonas sp. S1-29]
MAKVALDPAYRRIDVDEFLSMHFGDAKAELEDGLIYMMTGGSQAHARIAGNVYFALRLALRGTGCMPFNSDCAVQTGTQTIRYPDVAVYCGDPGRPANDGKKLLGDPMLIVEVLSSSTASYDQSVKLAEYRELPGTTDILLVDPQQERVRHVRRTATGWVDDWLPSGTDVALPSLATTLPLAQIFARD